MARSPARAPSPPSTVPSHGAACIRRPAPAPATRPTCFPSMPSSILIEGVSEAACESSGGAFARSANTATAGGHGVSRAERGQEREGASAYGVVVRVLRGAWCVCVCVLIKSVSERAGERASERVRTRERVRARGGSGQASLPCPAIGCPIWNSVGVVGRSRHASTE